MSPQEYVRRNHSRLTQEHYIVVHGWNVGEITERVNYLIEFGFYPLGGVSTLTLKVNASDTNGSIIFDLPHGGKASADGILFQAMMKLEDE